MLEKVGLPPKPSMKGANWVIDASHCQGCSCQFTFFVRKHHCRRCGGIFCNSCTQQRMVLRGQGESPVRICDPCKKLEVAARFEQRFGHRNRATKASSKQILKTEDELLVAILGTDGKHFLPPKKELPMLSDSHGTGSSAAHASSSVVSDNSAVERDGGNSGELHNDEKSSSPEDLRQQAMEEKKRYRILKAEGKADEALKAFKYGKELERQASAQAIAIRKNRKLAGKISSISSSRVSTDRMDDDNNAPGCDKNVTSLKNEGKDDLFTELRQLGWSDADLHDTGKKPAKLSVEGEFSGLLGETFQKSEMSRKKTSVDKTQVIALKRKALLLKREGKLSEAKEELKQAKILEKQLEEQEFLGEGSDTEDELYTLIENMGNNDNQDDLIMLEENDVNAGANFEQLLGAVDDFSIDANFEVTEDDMNDPELGNALRSFGWSDDEEHEQNEAAESISYDREALQAKILDLKKQALSQRRAGNVPDAMDLLKKAKLLEQDLENICLEPGLSQKTARDNQNSAPKSKLVIQKELLAFKKNALTLKREGRLAEAEEVMKKGKVLEEQLDKLENASNKTATIPGEKCMEPTYAHDGDLGAFNINVDDETTDVTEQDMIDPTILSSLKNLGWLDDESDSIRTSITTSELPNKPERVPATNPWKSARNKADIRRELLAIKRKALSLRRQGKPEEAEEELERAKDLEKRLADLESQSSEYTVQRETHNSVVEEVGRLASPHIETNIINEISKPSETLPVLASGVQVLESYNSSKFEINCTTVALPEPDHNIGASRNETSHKLIADRTNKTNDIKGEILSHKRNAVALKKEGKLIEAKEELKKVKLLEKRLEEDQESSADDKLAPAFSISGSTSNLPKPASSRDGFKLQQESLAHKRNALKLRREGKIREAEVESEKAKELESRLERLGDSQASSSSVTETGAVEDLLDPQLMSALKSIGWDDKNLMPKTSEKPRSSILIKEEVSGQPQLDRTQLEEQIKATKLQALQLRRAGKQDEALEALRSAKKLKKKLDPLI